MLISIGIVSAIAAVFVLEWILGIMPLQVTLIALPFPLLFIPFSIFCWWIARRGWVRRAVTLYVWTNFIGIALAIFVFDGLTSPAWSLYIWTVTIAGTLIAPGYALGMMGIVLGYYLLLSVLGAVGWYRPLMGLSLYGDLFTLVAFTLIILVSTVGGVTYLNMRSLREALGRLRAATRELEEQRRTLEKRVAERTADLARRTAQLEAASAVARRAAEIRDVDDLLNETVRLISEQFGFYHAGIFLIDEAGEYAVLRAASSEGGKRMLARGHRLAVGEMGIVGYVAGTGKPRIALDVGADAVFFSNPDLPHTHSEMALPLKVGDRVIGVLDVQSVEPSAFTDEDVAVLQTMADQITLAIENARLLSEVQDRLREVEALSREYARREWAQMVSERPGWGYVYDGVEVRPREQASPPEGISSGLTVPLQLASGETIGRVALALPDRPPADEDVALVQAVAQQAALALESARLFQETRQTLSEMEALYQASRVISTAGSPDEILHAFVDHVIPAQVDRCILALLDPESSEEPTIELVAAWDRGKERSPVVGRRWGVAQIPFLSRLTTDPVVVSDVANDPKVDDASRYVALNILGIRAFLAVPLMAGQRLLGWLLVESLSGPYPFTDREIRLYRTLADQAAVALERMRLFEETRRRAEWERIRAEVAARVRASTDMETILRTAVREMGRALRASEGIIQLGGGDGHGD
ncbi:MAG: GAF domain-containing protein [Thermoflexales bacterium]|nr:GAF domain-containing protein [Thermoflexales bacterium]